MICLTANAGDAYEVGELVEVFMVNNWLPAKVVEVNKQGAVRAEFVFGNSTLVELFRDEAVRHKYESGAMARGRQWADALGKFKVRAALLEVELDKIVIRTDDNRKMTIEISKLCEADQKFIRKLREEAGNGVALSVAPKPEKFAIGGIDSSPRSMIRNFDRTKRVVKTSGFRLASDPMRANLKLKQAGVSFREESTADRFQSTSDTLGSIIPLGGNDSWVMLAISNMSPWNKTIPTRTRWVSLTKGKVQSKQSLPPWELVLDYHPSSKRLLTQRYKDPFLDKTTGGEPFLTVWEMHPTATEAKGIVSWNARVGQEPVVEHKPWARFASPNVVIQRDENNRVIAWDIERKSALWSTVQEAFFAPDPLLSHNGKYLFIPEDNQLRILDPQSGKELGNVTPPSFCSGIALNGDGKTLAILSNNRLLLVDLTGEHEMRDLDATFAHAPNYPTIEWVTNELLTISLDNRTFVLFSIEHQLPIWTYKFDGRHELRDLTRRTRAIVDGHLVYGIKVEAGDADFVLGAVQFPEQTVLAKLSKIQRTDYMLMGKGTRVKTRVESTESIESVRSSLKKQLAENQWIEDPNAEFVVIAKLFRGQTQSVQYESLVGNQSSSISATPYISQYEIYRGETLLWSSSSSSGIPPILHLREGQSAQSEAKKWEAADVEFFSRTDIPFEVLNPDKQGGLGTSDITIQGIIPRK